MAYLGFVYVVFLLGSLHADQPARFCAYLALAALTSVFQARQSGVAVALSLSLPVVLIAIADLSRPEAVAVGCAAVLTQCLLDAHLRRHPSQMVARITVIATMVASAHFALTSLVPEFGSVTVRLFLVAAAFFVVNTLPAAIVLRFTSTERLGHLWRTNYFWSFPYYLVAAGLAALLHNGQALTLESSLLALPVVYVVYRYYRLQRVQLESQQRHAGEMAALHLRAIEGLALAVEAKDVLNTRGHLRRVQTYSMEIGKDFGLKGAELEALQAGALLHDIGKLAVPEHILTKPGKLTPEEFAKMKVHPVVGAEIVEQVQFPYPVAPIVRAHHEHWDGSGYPVGLKGEEIPLGARILSVVDCLDALTSDREYRKGVPVEEAVEYIRQQAGKHFDPKVVEVLGRRYRDIQLLALANESSGRILSTGVVIQNGNAPAAGFDTSGRRASDFMSTISAARREDQFLGDMSRDLGTSLDLNETMVRVESRLQDMIPHHALVLFIRRANNLASKFATGSNERMLSFLEVPVGQGMAGWVAETGNPVVNGNPTVDPGFFCEPNHPLESALAMPLEGAKGLLGVLALYHENADGFTHDQLRMLLAVTPKVAIAVENALRYREADERAKLDPLTGLPNRQLLREALDAELARSRRLQQPVAVLHCTVTGMPPLDELAADELLCALSANMKRDGREYDHIGRIGTHEFAIVLPGMKTDSLPVKLARLWEILEQSRGSSLGVGLSVGASLYPEDGEGSGHLLALAARRAAPLATVSPEVPDSLRSLRRATDDRRAGNPTVLN